MHKTTQASFWDFAVARYQRSGVESRLLALQDDAALNVNFVLWCCWCAGRYTTISAVVMEKAIDTVAPWHDEVIVNIRAARRAANRTAAPGTFYDDLKKIELDAERIQIEQLETIALRALTKATPQNEIQTAQENLSVYLATQRAVIDDRPRIAALLYEACSHIFDDDCDT